MTATPSGVADLPAFDMAAAPMRIGRVRLAVRDLHRVSRFYRDTLGLALVEDRGDEHLLGVAGTVFLVLHGDPALQPGPRGSAGLFHIAFLLPARADLGRWLAFAVEAGIRVQGASDHKVSEAVYLSDPEGNGIEIYADRSPAGWTDANGDIEMSTDPLDVESLLAEAAGTRWAAAPAGTLIGHVHLQVGDTARAETFYSGLLGFGIAKRYPGASFFGSGGYHHQLAGNIWTSRGAPPREPGHAGLAELQLVLRNAGDLAVIAGRARAAGVETETAGGDLLLDDPWGSRIRISAG